MSTPETPSELPAISAIESIYGPPPAKPDPAPPAAAAPPADPPPADDPPPEAPDTEDPPPVSDPPAEVEEVELSTVAELAEHLQVEQDFLKNLKVSEKVNGTEVQFSIAEALATHRKVQAGDTYLADAKEKSKAMLAETEQQKQSWSTAVATVQKLLQSVESEIARDSKTLLTDKLKEEDPALYAVRQNELRERRERLDALKREAQQGVESAVQKTTQEQREMMLKRLPQERELLLERVPEWADNEKSKPERDSLASYLQTEGFNPVQVNSIVHDGRLTAAFVKAMRYDASKQKLATIKKKVVKIPKVLKPGPKALSAPKPNGAEKSDPVSILYG